MVGEASLTKVTPYDCDWCEDQGFMAMQGKLYIYCTHCDRGQSLKQKVESCRFKAYEPNLSNEPKVSRK